MSDLIATVWSDKKTITDPVLGPKPYKVEVRYNQDRGFWYLNPVSHWCFNIYPELDKLYKNEGAAVRAAKDQLRRIKDDIENA